MAEKPKQKLLKKAIEQASLKWLMGRVAALQIFKNVPGAIKASNWDNRKLFQTGEMFLYHYDPKYKNNPKVLPYYDTFPLVIPIEYYENGFLGLNLHYLPPKMRNNFLTKLTRFSQTSPGDNKTRMLISYEIIKDANNLKEYIPCLKRYLIDHVNSKIMKIQPHEWGMAVNLPIANFVRATETKVWSDSRKEVNNVI